MSLGVCMELTVFVDKGGSSKSGLPEDGSVHGASKLLENFREQVSRIKRLSISCA